MWFSVVARWGIQASIVIVPPLGDCDVGSGLALRFSSLLGMGRKLTLWVSSPVPDGTTPKARRLRLSLIRERILSRRSLRVRCDLTTLPFPFPLGFLPFLPFALPNHELAAKCNCMMAWPLSEDSSNSASSKSSELSSSSSSSVSAAG